MLRYRKLFGIFQRNIQTFCFSQSEQRNRESELLSDPNLATRLSETRAAGEVKALETFYQTMHTEPARAYYGLSHVEKANENQAIELLLISDELFRSSDIAQRKRYVKLVENVKEYGGQARIFSSMHVSGEQLGQLSGIAAILRFPMPEIEEDDQEDENQNEHPD